MHIIRAFTHLQVQSIPEKYIFKRYTHDARSLVPWDRHDVVQVGPRGDTEQSWMSKLLPKLMRLGRAGSKTDRAYAETVRHLDRITHGIELLQAIELILLCIQPIRQGQKVGSCKLLIQSRMLMLLHRHWIVVQLLWRQMKIRLRSTLIQPLQTSLLVYHWLSHQCHAQKVENMARKVNVLKR